MLILPVNIVHNFDDSVVTLPEFVVLFEKINFTAAIYFAEKSLKMVL
jgi:hypothetical protein